MIFEHLPHDFRYAAGALLQDLRRAARTLARSPGFVLIAVLSLGLGLALNNTTFAVLDSLRHPYLPVKDPERVFQVGQFGDRANAFEKYAALRDGANFCEAIAIYSLRRVTLQGRDSLADQWIVEVSPNFFSLLGVRARMGRAFDPDMPAARLENTVVVSHRFWERELSGRPIEGVTLQLDSRLYSVIGVMPVGMDYPFGTDVWLAMPPGGEQTGARAERIAPVLRLKHGVSKDAVYAQLAVLVARLTASHGTGRVEFSYWLRPIVREPADIRSINVAMAGAAAAILGIVCANLAGLMLVRGVARRREVALRLALGAGRRAVVRQLLAESLLVALAGGALGFVASMWSIDLVANRMPPSAPTWIGLETARLSWRVLVFGLVATGATVLLFGLWPAIRASDVDLSEPLKDSTGTTTGRQRRHSRLVMTEVAMSLVLLMGAVLMVRAVERLSRWGFAYDRRGLLEVSVNAREALPSPDAGRRVTTQLEQRLRHTEGVRAAAAFHFVSTDGYAIVSDVYNGTDGILFTRGFLAVSPGYLGTLRIPVLEGRDFLPGDGEAGAAIVDDSTARQLWPDGDAVGRLIKLGDPESRVPWLRVVGIADLATGEVYAVSDHYASRQIRFAVRVAEGTVSISATLGRVVRDALPPGAGPVWVQPWAYWFDREIGARKFMVGVFGFFSILALTLTAIGLYSVLSYTVSQRMREFGVRIALGANRDRVLRQVLHDGAVMILGGIGIGAFAALFCAQFLGGWLYDMHPADVISLIVAEVVLVATSLGACVGPALRASRANPVEILRAS